MVVVTVQVPYAYSGHQRIDHGTGDPWSPLVVYFCLAFYLVHKTSCRAIQEIFTAIQIAFFLSQRFGCQIYLWDSAINAD